jgi:hypothetical protein
MNNLGKERKTNYKFVPEGTAAYQQSMKTKSKLFRARLFCAVALGIGSSFSLSAAAADSADTAPAKTSIPWSQLGAKAGADYTGEGLSVIATAEGARLRCVFQKLEGEATREGLWLTSTVIPPSRTVSDRFRIVATAVGRELGSVERGSVEGGASVQRCDALTLNARLSLHAPRLPETGTVAIDGQSARFTRPGLVEEYRVSMDGVRQDFVVLERPRSFAQERGELALWLAISGARVEPAAGGARLALENSGRKIAYSRLRVTDATGKELTARMEVRSVRDEGAAAEKEAPTPALSHRTRRAVAPSQRVGEGSLAVRQGRVRQPGRGGRCASRDGHHRASPSARQIRTATILGLRARQLAFGLIFLVGIVFS